MLDGITKSICRPPRAQYVVADLGPPRVRYRGVEYKRKDFTVKNSRNLAVVGSVWELINPRLGDSESCILYLHPNSGSRVDVVKTRIMSIAATAKCTVCGFDFSGCGSSEGDDVSLGVREKEDICAVMSFLLTRGCKRFVLWGRSMGAASAAMFFGAYKEALRDCVVALVLDSPFTSMQGLASEYTSSIKTPLPVPSLLLSPALHLLRQNVLAKHAFDILHISPHAAAARVSVPTVVLSGSEDKIVPPALSDSIYQTLNGPKLRLFFKGGHNTHRPAVVFDAIRVVLTGALRGLRPEEFLPLAEAVITNHQLVDPPSASPSPMHPPALAHSGKEGKGGQFTEEFSSDESSAAKQSALQQEHVVSGLLQEKPVESLTEEDIQRAIFVGRAGAGKKQTLSESAATATRGVQHPASSADHSIDSKGTFNDKKDRQDKRSGDAHAHRPLSHKTTVPPPLMCSVQMDVGGQHLDPHAGLSVGHSWSDTLGQHLHSWWGGSAHHEAVAASAPGSYGYVRRQLSTDVCPPDPTAWEELLLSRASSIIFDTAIDQILSITAGLEDARLEFQNEHSDMSERDEALMMSMIVAQVSAEVGLEEVRAVCIDGQTSGASSWSRLLLHSSLSQLQDLSRTPPTHSDLNKHTEYRESPPSSTPSSASSTSRDDYQAPHSSSSGQQGQ